MAAYQSDPDDRHLSLTCHATVLLGGLVGGWFGLALAALWLLPGAYHSIFKLDTFVCGGLGLLVGYFPGIGVCYAAIQVVNRKTARLVGFLAAAASAALICGFVAVILLVSAFV